ncbi:hypothetical protein DEO72_LG7g2540 [Vigna unguiculata]|uniref:Uncharacterized protein n=1 Tax=Vigna unguiculata TaxID=3917 RepID=A0A4D6MN91_VIGUN|nr:hypothetical protein DEO72_LG7g2540 [Vigna unguiculata]
MNKSLPLSCGAARALLRHQLLHLELVNLPCSELLELISSSSYTIGCAVVSLVRALLSCSPVLFFQSLPLSCGAARALLRHQLLHLELVNLPCSELLELISSSSYTIGCAVVSLVRALLSCSPVLFFQCVLIFVLECAE